MSNTPDSASTANWLDDLKILFFRFAATGRIDPARFENRLPEESSLTAHTGRLKLELVSHCWHYSHLLIYQLSSLVLHPPADCDVVMTVYYSEEDAVTRTMLEEFSKHQIPNISWNWQSLDKYALFRRSIGRNLAAKSTHADWIWFTDCDLVFHTGCLDGLNDCLQNLQIPLVYPSQERVTALLEDDDPVLLQAEPKTEWLKDIPTVDFDLQQRTRATGPLQITHGDVARSVGYCESIAVYQKPSNHWCKAHEDRAFRWLLRSQGQPVDIPGVYRIRHIGKGRYRENSGITKVRQSIRKSQTKS